MNNFRIIAFLLLVVCLIIAGNKTSSQRASSEQNTYSLIEKGVVNPGN